MKKSQYIFVITASLLSTNVFCATDTTSDHNRCVTFIPYFTAKENVYNKEAKSRFQLNHTIGVAAKYKSFDFKLFYGTTISTCDNYGKQLGASVGGITLTYGFDNIVHKQIIVPYATCRVNIYTASTFGFNPAIGLSFNYAKLSFRIFDGLNFRSSNLVASNVWGISVTYNFAKFVYPNNKNNEKKK